ncbi:hypothetical protein K6V78_11505 [Streptococcus gallolyticus]|nr:hypothetical protein [Streptococcus gallolyticus]MBY5042218.1 hypothetical protein [Streptococcus gallolyticus]
MEARSLGSHQHSWWFSHFSLREKLAGSHKKKHFLNALNSIFNFGQKDKKTLKIF